jgi:hypothetical protein
LHVIHYLIKVKQSPTAQHHRRTAWSRPLLTTSKQGEITEEEVSAASVQFPTKASLSNRNWLCARSLTCVLRAPVSNHKTDDCSLEFMQLLVTSCTYIMPHDRDVSKCWKRIGENCVIIRFCLVKKKIIFEIS